MSKKKIVRVGHGAGCIHEAESWTIAFAEALSHAGKYMNPQSCGPVIRLLMSGQDVWHDGVLFKGSMRDAR